MNRPTDAPETRESGRVRIDYEVALSYEIDAPSDFIFLVHPARTAQQRVLAETLALDPAVAYTEDTDATYGNRFVRVHAGRGGLALQLRASVEVLHVLVEPSQVNACAPAELPAATLRFMMPSRYCQSDQLQSLAWTLFGRISPGYGQVSAVANWVRANTTFHIGASSPATSALETLQARSGVCRDFAHLTIALCRALNYPARFVTGVDYGADPSLGPPDFHAYVEVFLDRWYLFDATGISPTTGLLRIGTGRDAADASFATIFGPVRTGMPIVSFRAHDDPAAGIALPRHTALAVSTSRL